VNFNIRVFAYLNGQTDLEKCLVCGGDLVPKRNPILYCSTKCIANSPFIRSKTMETNSARYGVDNFAKVAEFKTISISRNRELYGVDNYAETAECKDKKRKTSLEKYGCTHPLKNYTVLEKQKKTNLKNFGKEHFSQTDQFKTFVRNKILGEYYSPEIRVILEDKNKMNKMFEESSHNCQVLANILKVSFCTITRYLKLHDIPLKFEKFNSAAEIHLLNLIKDFYVGEIITNTRKLIPPFEIDIYFPEHGLAIEFNGVYWHSENQGKDKNYHLNKTLACEKQGIQLLHIFDNEPLELWLSVVKSKLGICDHKIGARKTIVRDVSDLESRSFLEQNHLQGYVSAAIRKGLFHEGKLVALMTFNKSRFSKSHDWELIRFCSEKNYQVIGAASKLLKAFRIENKGSIISYANRRWSNGKLYQAIGFTYLRTSTPNHFYTKDYVNLHSRNRFQKHLLKDKLAILDPDLSAWKNMLMNGYDRIWDCGNLVYENELNLSIE
jgi:hypothetical protein